ncbi:hypothetical protein U1Q18_048556 [Sarracenia purpurea var. burkii]
MLHIKPPNQLLLVQPKDSEDIIIQDIEVIGFVLEVVLEETEEGITEEILEEIMLVMAQIENVKFVEGIIMLRLTATIVMMQVVIPQPDLMHPALPRREH